MCVAVVVVGSHGEVGMEVARSRNETDDSSGLGLLLAQLAVIPSKQIKSAKKVSSKLWSLKKGEARPRQVVQAG